MQAPIITIEDNNLSRAWAKAFIQVLKRPAGKCPPIIVSIGDFEGPIPPECNEIRAALDAALESNKCNPVDVSAMVIFPYKLWLQRKDLSCDDFSAICTSRLLPRLQALNTQNRRGTYFERMMSYKCMKDGNPDTVNQLSEVVSRLRGDRHFRATGLQMTCFDPARDHNAQPRLGFPCLQHVGVTYEGDSGIVVTGFYPSQHIFARAYGNYLGLTHLGLFLADQTKLNLRRIICIATRPLLGGVSSKGKLHDLRGRIDRLLSEQSK
jgi:hypothetical protein